MQSDYNAMHNVDKMDRGKMSVSFNIKIIAVNYHTKGYYSKNPFEGMQVNKIIIKSTSGNKITMKNNIQA